MVRLFLAVPRSRLLAAALAAFLVVGTSFVPAAVAQTPTLGDVAQKEQERRKALPAAAKVYTNKDLPKSAIRPEGAPAAGPAADAPASGPAEGDAAASDKADLENDKPEAAASPLGDEASWKKRMSDAREELRRNEMFAQALQTRINSLSNDMLGRDDPAQRGRIAGDRKEAIAELARVKQEIENGRKAIAEIEEEARKAGVPPGWLR